LLGLSLRHWIDLSSYVNHLKKKVGRPTRCSLTPIRTLEGAGIRAAQDEEDAA